MPSVSAQLNVSVDTGDLEQKLGAQVGQLQQVIALVSRLIDNPPAEFNDFTALLGNLPLPEFALDGDFSAGLVNAIDALPPEVGDLTGALDGDLNQIGDLIAQLQALLHNAVRAASSIERLVSMDFRCTGDQAAGGQQPASPPAPPLPGENPAADRMARTAGQVQQVNDMLDRLPADPTVGSLVEFFLPANDPKRRNRLFQLTLPVLDDIVEPLKTLSRWSAADATTIAAELEATLARLVSQLRDAARQLLDSLLVDLNAAQPQLALPALTSFADAYQAALADLVSALDAADTAAIASAMTALNQLLDGSAATLSQWDSSVASMLQALCTRLDTLPGVMLDRVCHLLTLLEPVVFPHQAVSIFPVPQAPEAAVISAVQDAVEPIFNRLEELLGVLDFSAVQAEIAGVATQAQAVATAIEAGLTGVAVEAGALFDDVSAQLAAIDLNTLRAQIEGEIAQFSARLQRELGNAFAPAATAIAGVMQQLSTAVDAVDATDIVAALQSVLQAIADVLGGGEIAAALATVREALATVTATLEQLSFAPVTNEVVGLIEQMTGALRELQQSDMNDAAKAALSVALEVLPDDLQPVTGPILVEFDALIEGGPVPLLKRVAAKPQQLLEEVNRFSPGNLIGESLATPYRAALGKMEGFKPSALINALDSEFQTAKQALLKNAKPSNALNALSGPFQNLKTELQRYSPDTLLAPLEARIEQSIQQVIAASPVDEVTAQVGRVFDVVNQALSVPTALVQTMQRIDSLMSQLSQPDQQIDNWRDALLDKVAGIASSTGIDAALADLNSALQASAHTTLLGEFDNQVAPLQAALNDFAPATRLTALLPVYNRARSLAEALPASPDKAAVVATLERFDPGRTTPLRVSRELQQCLGAARAALLALQQEWQELLEGPDSLLVEMAAFSAGGAALRALLATAAEPLLSPLRYLFRLLSSLQPALQGMLASLTGLVDRLTAAVSALVTGPGSLQIIADAVQQVVDTLRNIDLGFLRQNLQQLFQQLLGQLEALNPASLGQQLDQAMMGVLAPLGLGAIVPPASTAALDGSFDSVLAKLRQIDPQVLVTDVVQPEYDALVAPLIAAFDLSPAFNALIEFLRNLAEELDTELGRVNSAYQGLRAARPELGPINVGISL